MANIGRIHFQLKESSDESLTKEKLKLINEIITKNSKKVGSSTSGVIYITSHFLEESEIMLTKEQEESDKYTWAWIDTNELSEDGLTLDIECSTKWTIPFFVPGLISEKFGIKIKCGYYMEFDGYGDVVFKNGKAISEHYYSMKYEYEKSLVKNFYPIIKNGNVLFKKRKKRLMKKILKSIYDKNNIESYITPKLISDYGYSEIQVSKMSFSKREKLFNSLQKLKNSDKNNKRINNIDEITIEDIPS